MRRAARMHVNRRAEFRETPGGAGMIEMNVTEENVADILNAETSFRKLRGHRLEGRFRAGIEKDQSIVCLEDGRGDDARAAKMSGIEHVHHERKCRPKMIREKGLWNENGGAVERAGAQRGQSFIRLLEREGLRLRPDRNARRKLQKFFAVAPRQIRDRRNRPLVPQIAIRKRGDVAHMDAGADDASSSFQNPQRCRHERADRRKDNGGVEFFRRRCVRSARPVYAQPSANFCASISPGRVKAKTSRPSWRATCATMWAAAPKP